MDIDAKELMEEGWKARESLEFEKAEKLLTQAKEAFEKQGDWFNVTEALNHLAYNEKLRAINHNQKGMKYAEESLDVAKRQGTKTELALRALMSLASSAGLFEQALKWAQKMLQTVTKTASRADILSHIATFQLRTGKLTEAEASVEEAEALMRQGFDDEREPHRSIWKSRLLATKGIILYNKGDLEGAKKCINEALEIATKQNIKTRIEEIKAIHQLVGDLNT